MTVLAVILLTTFRQLVKGSVDKIQLWWDVDLVVNSMDLTGTHVIVRTTVSQSNGIPMLPRNAVQP